ncbi:hypothetical protein VCHA53P481_160115 [Vibrio chagasii]|nr:hypothetical protein VCHA36O157_120123 [Vibrio chagasii]CAH6817440.1 hypothetical protein VCHA34P115_150019 [Vibrio chagasii]CAH6833128.1 hypothetical protein VCHA32O87_170018 [Vibrio chagasii]CAH6834948.1 hypothetical protein VCHA34P120_160020 [Vibrio chagasii]CAH6887860.1 hypothetical protein VCHA34P117_300018 [Vibrio chagasii]
MSDTDTCDVNIKGNVHHGQRLTRSTFIIFNQLPIPIFASSRSETLALMPRINQAQIKTWAHRNTQHFLKPIKKYGLFYDHIYRSCWFI